MGDRSRAGEAPTRWLPGPTWPLWAVAAGYMAVILPSMHAYGVAIRGRVSWAAVGVAIAVPLTVSFRQREYWRLTSADRLRVWRATRTGQPTGDSAMDSIVLDRLIKTAASHTWDRVVVPVMMIGLTAIPIVAAVRQSPWWLCALLPTIWWIQAVRTRFTSASPVESLQRFRSAMAPDSAS